jgi:4-hydroxybenzoate polyprenyltransferase
MPPKPASASLNQLAVESQVPLVVDLESALLRTDLLEEAMARALKGHPRALCRALARWVVGGGREVLAEDLSAQVTLDFSRLPMHVEVQRFLQSERRHGRPIVLVSTSPPAWAAAITAENGLSDNVLLVKGGPDRDGEKRLAAIQAFCREHGFDTFDYVGPAETALAAQQAARGVYLVAPTRRAARLAAQSPGVMGVFEDRKPAWATLFRALRPHQWLKNLLVFVPLLLSHKLSQLPLLGAALVAFLCMSLCASGVYLVNDLLDVDSDRRHPAKRRRPIAAGRMSLRSAAVWSLLLPVGAMAIAAAVLPPSFAIVLGIYYVSTCLYSLVFKRVAVLDVVLLAGFYILRVIAGGVATGIRVSEWLLAFSGFFFMSLAFAKRYAELSRLNQKAGEKDAPGRGYRTTDIGLIETLGPPSGYLSVLVFALYLNSNHVRQLYSRPEALWLLCPVLFYWLGRLWLKAKRGELSEDPVVFAMKDGVSISLGLLTFVILMVVHLL